MTGLVELDEVCLLLDVDELVLVNSLGLIEDESGVSSSVSVASSSPNEDSVVVSSSSRDTGGSSPGSS